MTRLPPLTSRRRASWPDATTLFWIVAILVLGAGLGLRDPWPADEPRFALVAKQMVESGDWLFPHRGSELYSDKPPLFMWLQAVFYALLGNLRLAFLLPSLASALGTLWLVRDLGKRLWTVEAGQYAAWCLLFTLQFTFQAKRAQIDPFVTFCITLSMYSLLRHLLCGPDWRMWALGWFAAGLGVISKGVGVVALLVLLPAAWAQWRGWPGLTRLRISEGRFWVGPLFLLLPILSWLLPMLLTVRASGDPALHAYANDILFRQTAGRYANAWHHQQPIWYFPVVMLTQWLPTILALPWVLRPWRDGLRDHDPRLLLPLAWVALVVLFFSMSAGKREVYILPALPMLCLALGPWLPKVVRMAWPRRIAFLFATLLSAVLLLAGLLVVFGDPGFESRLGAVRGMPGSAAPLGAMLAAIGAFGMAALSWFRVRDGVTALLATLAGVWVGYSLIGYPLLNDASSARGLMMQVGEHIGPDAELGMVAWKEQNLLMADRPVKTFGFLRPADDQLREACIWQQQASQERWLLVQGTTFAVSNCVDWKVARELGVSNRREWWLVPPTATRPAP